MYHILGLLILSVILVSFFFIMSLSFRPLNFRRLFAGLLVVSTLTVPIVAREIFSFNNELVDELIYAFIAINAIYASILIGIGFKYGEKYTKCGKAQLIAAIFYCIFLYYASLINYS